MNLPRKKIFFYLFIFLGLPLLAVVFILVFGIFLDENMRTKIRLTQFVHKYETDIKTQIFEGIFPEAQKCTTIPKSARLEDCRKSISLRMGNALHEEELMVVRYHDDPRYNEYNWPHDLFFVRQQGDSFWELGWSGEIKNISYQVNKKKLWDHQSYFPLIFQRGCGYFRVSEEYYYCEVYETITLDNGAKGYVARMYPGEENYLLIFTLLPFIWWPVTLPVGLLLGALLLNEMYKDLRKVLKKSDKTSVKKKGNK